MNAPEILLRHPNEFMERMGQSTAFSRLNEEDDAVFYARDRLVDHLDRTALEIVETLIGGLIIESRPAVLDLMASCNSHLPAALDCAEVVGLGMNRRELEANPRLTEHVIHDLNRQPELPFADNRFDVVLNVVSVDYLIHPVEVFNQAARVLKPGGLFLVVFSNRFFPQKVVRLWTDSSEDERNKIVQSYFARVAAFEDAQSFACLGRPRPEDDRYAGRGLPSDPIYAVYAEKFGAPADRAARPTVTIPYGRPLDADELARRVAAIPQTHACPYCGERLRLWAVTENPFTTYENDLYICVNDACGYLVRGWNTLYSQGNSGSSYRLMYNPRSGNVGPIPVPNLFAIMDELID